MNQAPRNPDGQVHDHAKNDGLFAWLLLFQLAAGFLLSVVVSPGTWISSQEDTYPHVLLALIVGSTICLPALVIACRILQRRADRARSQPASGDAASALVVRTAKLEAAYRRLEGAGAFLGEVYRAVPGLLFVVDSHNHIVLVNDGAKELLEFQEEDMIGQPLGRFFVDADDLDYPRMVQQAKDDQLPFTERTCRKLDGTTVPVFFSARRLPPGNGDRSFVCVGFGLRGGKDRGVERSEEARHGEPDVPAALATHPRNGAADKDANPIREWPRAGFARREAA